MLPVKRIVLFFVVAIVVYAALVVPRTPFVDAYRYAFRVAGDVLFQSVGDGGSVRFVPFDDKTQHDKDTTLRLTNRKRNISGSAEIRAVFTGYRPTAFLIALVLATPIPWRRRGWSLVWGLLLVSVFVAFRVWLRVVDFMSNGDVIAVYQLGATAKGLLRVLVNIFALAPAPGYIVPGLIWILVCFRKGDWERLTASTDPSDAPPETRDLKPSQRSNKP